MLLTKKYQFLSLFTIDQKKKKEIKLGDFTEKKKPFFTLKNRVFPKNRIFSKGLTHAFGQKMPFLSLLRFCQNKTSNNA